MTSERIRARLFLGLTLILGIYPKVARAAYGTTAYTITKVAAISFTGETFIPTGSLGREAPPGAEQHFYATLDIPAGVIIDFIGVNNLNDGTPNVLAVHLWERFDDGSRIDLADLDNTPHTTWATDINGAPIG